MMKLETIKKIGKEHKFAILFFMIGFAISIFMAPYGIFCDEADVITASWLMSKGELLYKDIFSHHMPVPYFFLEIFQFFSNNLVFLRISFAIVTQAYFILLYLFFRKKLHPYVIPIVSVLWGLVRHMFMQQMILADTFVALGLFTVFLEIVTHKEAKYALKDKILIAFATFISFGSSLIVVYPLMIFYLYYIIKRIVLYVKEKEKALAYFKEDLGFAGIVLCPFFLFAFYLLATNTWGDFWENAIFFNTDYYSLYNGEETPITLILNQFLNFPHKTWLHFFISTAYFPDMFYYTTDMFISFNYLVFLVWSVIALWRYKKRAILYILFIYFCYMRDGFHVTPFILFTQYMVAEALIWAFSKMKTEKKAKPKETIAVVLILFYAILHFALLGNDLKGLLEGNEYVTDYGKEYKDVIIAVTEEEDTIWAVPMKAELYFVTNRMPANENIFYLPWQSIKSGVNEEIQKDLIENKAKVIVYDGEELLWSDKIVTSEYCGWLEEFLQESYFTIKGLDNVYFLKEEESKIIEKLIEKNIVRREENGEIVCSNASV